MAIVLLVAFQKLKKDHADLPICIQQKIDEIKAQKKWNPPAEVHEYFFKGMRVFYFSSNCCDQYNVVVDEKCNYICAPSGGTTGKGDGKCSDFLTMAQYIKLIWKDERNTNK
jgi:uncharacterized protein DUF6970